MTDDADDREDEVKHVSVTVGDAATMTGVDAVTSINASVTAADHGTMTGVDAVKVTWRGWRSTAGIEEEDIDLEAKPYLTRSEVVDAAKALDVPLTERMLRGWEYNGALPRPERRWHEGHRSVQTVYPIWMPQLIRIAYDIHRDQMIAVPDLGPLVSQQVNRAILLTHMGGDVNAIVETAMPPLEKMLVDTFRQTKREGRSIETWRVTTTATVLMGDEPGAEPVEPIVREFVLTTIEH